MQSESSEWLSPRISVPYSAVRFPSGVLPVNDRSLEFTTADLAHALFATGRAPGDRLKYGKASVWEWLHRASLIPAYLRRHYDASLRRSRLATELDRSELAAVSYAIGQAATGIFCNQKLGVSHVLHVDRYAHSEGVQFIPRTRQRPDLFGLSANGWIVAEAKGRTRGVTSEAIAKIAEQKRVIGSIGGQAPYLTIGCIASFPPPLDAMRLDAIDPIEERPELINIPMNLDQFMLSYYSPLLDLIDSGGAVEVSDDYISGRFVDLRLEVLLRGEVYRQVRRAQEIGESGLFAAIQGELGPLGPQGAQAATGRAPDVVEAPFTSEEFGTERVDGSIFVADWGDEIRASGTELLTDRY